MRAATIWLCLALGFAAAAGCGGDDEPAAAEKPTSVVAADLDKDGEFWLTLTPDLKDELVDYGVYVYGSAADARRSASDFEPVERDLPDQIEVRGEGANLYVGTVEEPATLPQDKFDAAVAAAEGG